MKILFGSVPADGHFNPLTGLAVHLAAQGHEVRWYAGKRYAAKLERMGIPHQPFVRALEWSPDTSEELFPGRKRLRGPAQLRFDAKHLFIDRMPEYYEDLRELKASFPFDVLVCDALFPGPIVEEKLHTKVAAVGVTPLSLSAPEIPAYGLGHRPARSPLGWVKQRIMQKVAGEMIFKQTIEDYNAMTATLCLPPASDSIFDLGVKGVSLYLQNGPRELDYPRRSLPSNVRYVGALPVWSDKRERSDALAEWTKRLSGAKRVLLISQGTAEKDPEKLIVPAIEAFIDRDVHLVVTTAGHQTAALSRRFPQPQVIIEDFIDYRTVMPLADVFVTNGGFGSVLMSVESGLPMVAAGAHEGKNEICARLHYAGLGIDLRSERPSRKALRRAVSKVLEDSSYRRRAHELRETLRSTDTLGLCQAEIERLSRADQSAAR